MKVKPTEFKKKLQGVAMFGYSIFGSQPAVPTRFDHCEELKPIAVILASLRKKEAELKRAKVYRGAESVDFEKHTVVAKLLEEMDAVIDAFNEQLPQAERENEVIDMMNLVEALENLVKSTLLRHTD